MLHCISSMYIAGVNIKVISRTNSFPYEPVGDYGAGPGDRVRRGLLRSQEGDDAQAKIQLQSGI